MEKEGANEEGGRGEEGVDEGGGGGTRGLGGGGGEEEDGVGKECRRWRKMKAERKKMKEEERNERVEKGG